MKSLIFVFIGGGLGSVFRYVISKLIPITKNGFPVPTFLANILGCFLIGLIIGWAIKNDTQNSDIFLFLAIGLCGGLTTFSSYSYEGLSFIKDSDYLFFIIYNIVSVFGGIAFLALGIYYFKLKNQ